MANFCSNCGKEINDSSKFCSSCGSSINGNAYSYPGQKSKMAAGLLGIFLGAWGIHNFYLGNNNRGIVQIILTVCSCGIGGLWGFIEGVLILTGSINTDANGNPLGE